MIMIFHQESDGHQESATLSFEPNPSPSQATDSDSVTSSAEKHTSQKASLHLVTDGTLVSVITT